MAEIVINLCLSFICRNPINLTEQSNLRQSVPQRQENRHSVHSVDSLIIQPTRLRQSTLLEVPAIVLPVTRSFPDELSSIPPAYQENDPLPSLTRIYTRHEHRGNLQRSASILSDSELFGEQPEVVLSPGGTMARMDSFVSNISGSVSDSDVMPILVPNATTGGGALVLQLSNNLIGLGMTEAPPTYEEASSSQV